MSPIRRAASYLSLLAVSLLVFGLGCYSPPPTASPPQSQVVIATYQEAPCATAVSADPPKARSTCQPAAPRSSASPFTCQPKGQACQEVGASHSSSCLTDTTGLPIASRELAKAKPQACTEVSAWACKSLLECKREEVDLEWLECCPDLFPTTRRLRLERARVGIPIAVYYPPVYYPPIASPELLDPGRHRSA